MGPVVPGKESLIESIFRIFGYVVAGFMAVSAQPIYRFIKTRTRMLNWTNRKIDSQKFIYDKLGELRASLDVDRVAIIEFSNSEKSVSNFPFLFVTMTYERVSDHIAPIKEKMNKIPSSWFVPFNSFLVDESVHSCKFFKDGKILINDEVSPRMASTLQDASITHLMHSYGMESRLFVKFTKSIGDGILDIVQYDRDMTITSDQVEEINGAASYIWFKTNVKH